MTNYSKRVRSTILVVMVLCFYSAIAQIGARFPSEKKIIKDTLTGTELTFLTSESKGDSKIYPTHNQWTSDGEWVIFRSHRVEGEAMAVNEKTGEIVQVTEGGYMGMLTVARKSMKLYFMRQVPQSKSVQIVEVDLDKVFKDSFEGKLKLANAYQKVSGLIPEALGAGGDMALDANEQWVWFRVGREAALKHLNKDVVIEKDFGPRGMGAGPGGIAGMKLSTGEIKHVISVPFQVGHIQSNPWVSGQIIFCWETGGKSPQRTWIVNSDGSGLRPLYPESKYEWVTHEAVITPNEVAFAIMGHRQIPESSITVQASTGAYGANLGQQREWGPSGTREKPTGLGIVNINTRAMSIIGQTPSGSGLWHVHGSPDGRFAVGDDFSRSIYLINRETKEMVLLSAGHKQTAADHPHPTFSPDGTKIVIQSAMLSKDGKNLNICIIPVPEKWLTVD